MALGQRGLVGLVEAGLVACWVRQARWNRASSIRHLGGIAVVLSGVPDQTQQVALVEGVVLDAEASVVAAEVCFDEAGWRPAFDLAERAHPELEAALRDRGFGVIESRPGMVRPVGPELPTELFGSAGGATIHRADPAARQAIIGVQQGAFGLSPGIAAGMVPPAMLTDPDVAVIVARLDDGEVVGAATVHLSGPTAALVGLAVIEAHRRKGIGTSLTVAALALARRRGLDTMWLQTTPDGLGLYQRLGFVEVAPWQVWVR